MTLHRALPALVAGTAARTPQDSSRASYFGGRKPEDGVIDWSKSATEIHNLVRALAPPYPGARTTLGRRPARILRTRVLDAAAAPSPSPELSIEGGRIVARCGGGGTLAILELELEGAAIGPEEIASRLRPDPVPLGH
jgi:methionyl-tRNA formyltransferase